MIVEEQKAGEFRCARLQSFECIGSRCMAWRWTSALPQFENGLPVMEARSPTHGYCGLAGRP